MKQIQSEQAYRAALHRIDELLPLVSEADMEKQTPHALELSALSDEVEAYEAVHYPIDKPTLLEILQLRMYEMGINQRGMAELLGISLPQMSAIMSGKKEPSLSVARSMSRKLNISPNIVLGV